MYEVDSYLIVLHPLACTYVLDSRENRITQDILF